MNRRRLILTVGLTMGLTMAVLAACGDSPAGDDGPDAGSAPDAGWWQDASGPVVSVCMSDSARYSSLTEAITEAPDGATIELCPGVYTENLVLDGRRLVLRGITGQVVIDGGGAGPVIAAGTGADVVLQGLILRGGAARRGAGIHCASAAVRGESVVIEDNAGDTGGGVLAANCNLALIGSAVRNNRADDGAGLYVIRGSLEIIDSVIADNTADWIAGGLYVLGGAPVLRGNLVQGNTSFSDGAGLYIDQADALIENNVIRVNASQEDGGGLRIFTSPARLYGNQVSGNTAVADGGAAKISHLACDLRDNLIVGNMAGSYGGGLELDNDNSTVRGGVISDNLASRGGGIHMSLAPLLGGLIEDVQVIDNRAGEGAGIYLEENFTPIALRRVTVTGNRADRGGGGLSIRRTRFTVTNSLIAGNRAGERGGGLHIGGDDEPIWEEDCLCPPSSATGSIAFTVIHGNQSEGDAPAMWLRSPELTIASSIVSAHIGQPVVVGGSTAPAWRFNSTMPSGFSGMQDPTGIDGNLAADPRFVDPAGGNFHLAQGSPCIDAGDPAEHDRDASRADMGLHGGPEAP